MQRLISKGLIGLIAGGKALPPRVDQINCVDLTSKMEMLLFNQCRWFNQVNQYIPSTVRRSYSTLLKKIEQEGQKFQSVMLRLYQIW